MWAAPDAATLAEELTHQIEPDGLGEEETFVGEFHVDSDDFRGRVTTGLVYGVEYLKDNRVLPRGFDKATAGPDIAVHGDAAVDPDFAAPGDRVRYEVDVGEAAGPVTVRAELRYQPIGLRWAENLKGYDAIETNRFVRYCEDLSHVSGTVLAEAELRIE